MSVSSNSSLAISELCNGIDLVGWYGAGQRRQTLLEQRRVLRESCDTQHLRREDLAWARRAYVEGFLFGYDSAWFNREANAFDIDRYLDDGEANFGGYDLLILWQPYPRMGICNRSQLDFYRDWPGGDGGLAGMIERCHERGVRCLLNHVQWDQRRAHGWEQDAADFAALVQETGADGVYVDTMAKAPAELRVALDRIRPGLLIETEYNAPLSALATQSMSWAQNHKAVPLQPFVQSWVDRGYMIRMVDRSSDDRRELIGRALFWGHGVCVWENVFGWWNPFTARDRALLQRVVSLLRAYHDHFQDQDWRPLDMPLADHVHGNRFAKGDQTVITVLNTEDRPERFDITHLAEPGFAVYDVWAGRRLADLEQVEIDGLGCGCIVIQPLDYPPPTFAIKRTVLPKSIESQGGVQKLRLWPDKRVSGAWNATTQQEKGILEQYYPPEEASTWIRDTGFRSRVNADAMTPRPVRRTTQRSARTSDDGMIKIPNQRLVFMADHLSKKLEGGCYGNPAMALDHPVEHHWLGDFWIDRTEVTMSMFAEFLHQTSYRPAVTDRFLDNWVKPDPMTPASWSPPAGQSEHPVTWVDLDDARAFALWANKRLPTEPEWVAAAQGRENHVWPWGDRFEPGCCNHGTGDTTPVEAYPQGASPYGVLDMAGNVWEWTESQRDDGHTQFAILKGGSHLIYDAPDHPEAWGKMWYTAEGAQPNTAHQKMLLISPSLDRCGTIGFRCVQDA